MTPTAVAETAARKSLIIQFSFHCAIRKSPHHLKQKKIIQNFSRAVLSVEV